MKLKDLILSLSKEDILTLISVQEKITIKSLDLGNLIKVGGLYKVMGLNIDFDASMSISNLKDNVIYIDIKEFQISKKNSSNPLVKKTISFVTKSINDIEGMKLTDKLLTIDIEKILKFYFTDEYGIKLEKLEINTLNSINGVLELGINILELNINRLKK